MLQKLLGLKPSLKKTNEIIKQIHNEFDTAADIFLQEVQCHLKEEEKSYFELADKLGFSNIKGAEEVRKQEKEEHFKKQSRKIFFELSNKYPSYKLITKDIVMKICAKYNLVMADTENYIGTIPIKNLKEIQSFDNTQKPKIKNEDFCWLDLYFRTHQIVDFSKYMLDSPYYKTDSYKICCPKTDIKLSKNEKISGSTVIKTYPDPIVLFPLRDGFYFIVTKWGIEGEDPELVHEKMN